MATNSIRSAVSAHIAKFKSLDPIEVSIRNHPFAEAMKPRLVHLLAEHAVLEKFRSEDELFRETQDIDFFYLIRKGQVALQTFVPRAGSTTIQVIGPGGTLALSWLYPPYRWPFTAKALEPLEAIRLRADILRKRADEDFEFGYELLRRISRVTLGTLQEARRKLVEFYVHDLVE